MVFDKTGTITEPGVAQIKFIGNPLSDKEKSMIFSLASNSMHPLSKKIKTFFNGSKRIDISNFKEINGKGTEGLVGTTNIQIGSYSYLFPDADTNGNTQGKFATKVFIKIGNELKGHFEFAHSYRNGLQSVIDSIKTNRLMYLLSGDNDNERKELAKVFGDDVELHFSQSPMDKLNFIQALQKNNKKVLMIGDGLNDAGALKAASVGISITEDTAHFSPASDIIMDAGMFDNLPKFLKLSKNTLKVIHMSFVISMIYNIIGLSFAVQGTLSPLIAAILMPLSSVTVIAFTTITTTVFAKTGGLK